MGNDTQEMDAYLHALLVTHPLREAVLREAIRSLGLRPGSRGLDAGCGIGQPALMLAQAVGPDGHVTGLDRSTAFLAYARGVAERARLSDRVSFREGDVNALPFDDAAFDWAWSVDCVGYGAEVGQRALQELARVVRPGGLVAILMWSSQMLLPGHPGLEARLNATKPGIAPFVAGADPASHFLCALGRFRDLGLERAGARTFAGSACAPLDDAMRDALVALFDMRWPGAGPELSPADRAAYERLCRPGSPGFILDRPDYYAFFTYSLFHACKP